MNASVSGTDNEDVHIHSQLAVLTERTKTLSATVERHEVSMDGIYTRLQTIERLIYIGLGGLLAIGSLATFFGWNILKLLGK